MFVLILKIIFILSVSIQLFYWLFIFSKLAYHEIEKNDPPPSNRGIASVSETLPPVTVIICARNEAENLSQNLPYILNQQYPIYEVMLVDDASTDDTETILNTFKSQYNHLNILKISQKTIQGKKGALAAGIEAAQYEYLLLTDADCHPSEISDYPLSIGNKNWILEMVKGMEDKDIGLGYGPYEKSDSLLNKFIRFETIWTATQYMGLALAGFPYMGVGRNLIYKKNLYLKSNGFKNHQNIASGDDDLFIKSVINKKNFKIILNPKTFMYSKPKTQWNVYFTQKKRHLSTATSYTLQHKIMLGMLSMSHFFYFVTAIFLLTLKISTIFVIILIVTRTVVIWFFYGKILLKFKETHLCWWIPLLDALYVLFYVALAPALAIRAQKWR